METKHVSKEAFAKIKQMVDAKSKWREDVQSGKITYEKGKRVC